MAYVVARRGGRFEIRESLHTPKGPRARSLASFAALTDEVLRRAAARARRPFDPDAVIASGRRAGAAVTVASGTVDRTGDRYGRFVAASQRMASSIRRAPPSRRATPGESLIDLLGFTDAVARSQPPRPPEPLTYPALSRLAADSERGGRTR
jgi:hypothetical protein